MQLQIKKEIKTKIKMGLNPSDITSITITKSDLKDIKWLKEGKEMIYNNKLYDIIRVEKNHKSLTYHCIEDKREAELYAQLENHINTHVATNKPPKKSFPLKKVDNVIKLFFSSEKSFSSIPVTTISQLSTITILYERPLLERNFPPPRFI